MLNSETRDRMADAANAAIRASLLDGGLSVAAKRSEPAFVAAVTLVGVPAIAAAWEPLLAKAGYSLELTGVFCHQSPAVGYRKTSAKRVVCELADLLVVVDVDEGSGFRRTASLIQAKMAKSQGLVGLKGSSSDKQLWLYRNWPKFDFLQAEYELTNVDFQQGKDAAASGSFGIIDRHFLNSPSRPPTWKQLPPEPPPASTFGYPYLGSFMVDMVEAKAGREATPSLKTDWSRTIEKLIERNAGMDFRLREYLGTGSARRLVTRTIAFIQGSSVPQLHRDDGIPLEPQIVESEPGGICAVQVVIRRHD
jgi:hypothetical protein